MQTKLYEYQNYRDYFKDLLKTKQLKNKLYSMRSFAKTLGVSPAGLSLILKGTRNLSTESMIQIGRKLKLRAIEQKYLLLLVELHESKTVSERKQVAAELEELQWLMRSLEREKLLKDDFSVEWYHFALLERITMAKEWFVSDLVAFSKALGVDEASLRKAIQDLLVQGYISPVEGRPELGYIREPHAKSFTLVSPHSSATLRKIHRGTTERAMLALSQLGPERRYSASEYFSVDTEGFAQIKALTNQYLDQVILVSQKCLNPDRLFTISLHAFQLMLLEEQMKDQSKEVAS